jgi:putative Holliday junction resolvase
MMRFLGLDVGERRTGVALSDPTGWLASPLTVLRCTDRDAELLAVTDLVQKHQVGTIVVGDPQSLDGSIGPQSRRVRQYVSRLQQKVPHVSIVLYDERLSTLHAQRLLHESGRRASREVIDAAAAAVILQSYLDARQAHPAEALI